MRIALYDFSLLTAITTIEYPDAMVMSPDPAAWKIEFKDEVVLEPKLICLGLTMPRENKHNFGRAYVAMPAGAISSAICRAPFFANAWEHELLAKVPAQLRPELSRLIRKTMGMGEVA